MVKGKAGRPAGSKNKPKDTNVPFSAAGKKEKKPAEARVYEYTPLAETALGATALYNLYGVVIDAQTPRICEVVWKNQKMQKYRQQVRIIDQSMHYKNVETGNFNKQQ